MDTDIGTICQLVLSSIEQCWNGVSYYHRWWWYLCIIVLITTNSGIKSDSIATTLSDLLTNFCDYVIYILL